MANLMPGLAYQAQQMDILLLGTQPLQMQKIQPTLLQPAQAPAQCTDALRQFKNFTYN